MTDNQHKNKDPIKIKGDLPTKGFKLPESGTICFDCSELILKDNTTIRSVELFINGKLVKKWP